MIMSSKSKQRVYHVVLGYPKGITRSVFIKAKDRNQAEKRALRRNPGSHIN